MTARGLYRAVALVPLTLLVVALLAPAGAAWAHPLGNFTTNTYAGVLLTPTDVRVLYVLDLAEVPAFQAVRDHDRDGDADLVGAESDALRAARCEELADGLDLGVDDRTVALQVAATALSLPPGEAGLPTLRLECTLVAPLGETGDGIVVTLADRNAEGRVGWREVTATGDGMRLTSSDVPDATVSDELRRYPDARLASPLDVRTARVVAVPDGTVAAAPPLQVGEDRGTIAGVLERVDLWFTGLVAVQDLTVAFAALAVLGALGLGALHSLAPGHGKTVMAAYVVGREGSNRQAFGLAATVAVTHTLGVLILGAVLSATQALAPEQVYPYLGMASGVLFALIGAFLLRRALSGGGHDHAHDHDHEHGHGQGHHRHRPAGALTWRSLVAPGLAGGLVPSPSALLVLLGGIALGRAWFGVGLVIAYGIGMAATLVGAGYALLRARHRLERRAAARSWSPAAGLSRRLPVVTSSVILLVGIGLTASSALQV